MFSNHILYKNSLEIRVREFLILRIGWLNAAKYEWAHHVAMARQIGITEAEIECIKKGFKSPDLDPFESAILKAADELYENAIISNETWNILAERLDKKQLIDFLFTAGEYTLISWFLNSAGVQLEEGYEHISIPKEITISKKKPSSVTIPKEPRIFPLEEDQMNEETRTLVNRWNEISKNPLPNVHKTIIHNFKLFKRWRPFSNHILFKNSLPSRDREILILRIGWLCSAKYELCQHVAMSKGMGFSEDDFRHIWEGPESAGLEPFESALIRSVDELFVDAIIHDETWKKLSEKYNTKQLMDLIFTVGQYNLISIFLNSTGVVLDEWLEEY